MMPSPISTATIPASGVSHSAVIRLRRSRSGCYQLPVLVRAFDAEMLLLRLVGLQPDGYRIAGVDREQEDEIEPAARKKTGSDLLQHQVRRVGAVVERLRHGS